MGHNYLECISAQELDRLRAQHDAWLPETHSFLRDMGFSNAKKIIEYGCGPGLTALDLAKNISPKAAITAVDVSDYYLNSLRNTLENENISHVQVVRQNLAHQMESPDLFDAAFCRWFLAWVTSDIDTVLRNIHASLSVGGTFAAMEYLTLRSTVHSPPDPSLSTYLHAWEEFYLQAGGTTEVGAALPEKMAAAGFEILEIRCVGGFSPQGQRLFKWWHRLYQDFRAKFHEKGLLNKQEIDAMNQYWERNSGNPNAFIFSPVLIQIAGVKR